MPNKTLWRGRIVLLLASIFVTLLITEGLIRLFAGAPQLERIDLDDADSLYERSDNPILGYTLKRNYRGHNLHPGIRRTNALGFRDIDRPVEKRPGVRRIIMLGDSVTAGHHIHNLDATISRQVERIVGEDRAEVFNFGVGGYCTRAEVELLIERGLALNPDLVIVLFVENDYDDLNTELGQLRHYTTRPDWVEDLFVWSHLFRFISYHLDLWNLASDTDGVAAQAEVNDHINAVGDDNVREGLSLLRDLSAKQGFDVIIAIWPTFTRTGFVHRDQALQPIKEGRLRVETIAKDLSLPTLRLGPLFQKGQERKGLSHAPQPYYSLDGMHPNERGARLAAEAFALNLFNVDTNSK